jgi:DNA-binding NarL/FixJ family response regulator
LCRHSTRKVHVPHAQDNRRFRVRVLLADDHALYAETLALVLGSDDRLEVVGQAADGLEAVELASQLQPHVVLMDVHMPRLDGVEATRRLRAHLPGVPVVMLSSSDAVEDVERARSAGAAAYLTKNSDTAAIVEDVVRVFAGRPPLSARQAA